MGPVKGPKIMESKQNKNAGKNGQFWLLLTQSTLLVRNFSHMLYLTASGSYMVKPPLFSGPPTGGSHTALI